jgi:hypothetical protein
VTNEHGVPILSESPYNAASGCPHDQNAT